MPFALIHTGVCKLQIMFTVFYFYLYKKKKNPNTGPNPILVRLYQTKHFFVFVAKSCFSLNDTPSPPQLLVMHSLFKFCDHTSTLTISVCVKWRKALWDSDNPL